MRFIRQDVVSEADARALGGFDIAFHGRSDLDDRSKHSASLCASITKRQFLVRYDPETFVLTIGDKGYNVQDLEDVPRELRARSIVLDATTLEFPEILYLLHAYQTLAKDARPDCGFMYVEPESYKPKDDVSAVVHGNAFDLSSGFRPKTPLPIYNNMLSPNRRAHLIGFLGFEGSRVRRVLEDDDGPLYKQVSIVFGVPPFQPGWDLHSLLANSRLLEPETTGVMFCGANNPRSAYRLLKGVHAGVLASQEERIAVAPFGTKPMALGVALYCLENTAIRPLYDFPARKPGRTQGVHRRHWYSIDWKS
jgi:hypothetical protein